MTTRFTPPTRLRTALGIAALAGACSTLTVARSALADDVSGAANAFSRAQKAELSGDFSSAAELYELADGLAPAPEALRSALRARKAADQLDLAAVHAEELLQRYPNDARSGELANATLEDASKKLMRFEVACHPTVCTVLVDGAAAGPDAKEKHLLYLSPGKHEVIASFGKNRTDPQSAEGSAGDKGSLAFEAPPEPPPLPAGASGVGATDAPLEGDQGVQRSHGISPWFFVGGAIATVGLGAATIWSGLDVLSANNTYKKNPTLPAYNDGKDRELRTNVLIGATSVVGAATAIVAVFTNWHGKTAETAERSGTVRATASVTGNSAALVLSGVY
ncbi:MAG TPA: hypothetical protein VHU80_13145 [Polyangiaceae bacterium]|jgi:hypothetical protein|nr:hypothetical protein [Polyangiaceae bacterium]